MLTRYYGSKSAGGHQAYIRNISSFLIRSYDEVTIIAQKQNSPFAEAAPGSEKQINIIRVPFIDLPLLNICTLIFSFAIALRKNRRNFDVFVTHQILPALAASLAGVRPHIYTHHGFMYEHIKSKPARNVYFLLEYMFIRVFGRGLDCAIAVDLESSHRLQKHKIPTKMIPVYVDECKFNQQISGEGILHRYNLKDNIVVLSPKMFYRISGLEDIVRAFWINSQIFGNARLLLVGDGPLKSNLVKLVNHLGLENKVIFAGVMPADKMPEVYTASDVVVFNTLGGIQRTALLEAMASGKACIGTNIPPLNEVLIDHFNGVLVELNSVKGLSEALKEVLSDQIVRRRLGIEARRTVEARYSSSVALDIRSAYVKVAKKALLGDISRLC